MPRKLSALVAVVAVALPALGGAPGARAQTVPIVVDARAKGRRISPLVYGVSYGRPEWLRDARIPLTRLGGNNASRYNWRENADNRGNDWYFQSVGDPDPTPGERIDTFIRRARGAGSEPMITIPTIGWVGRLGPKRSKLASFSVAKYGAQTATDAQWFPDAGNGILRATGKPVRGNDPTDASARADIDFQARWVERIVGRFQPAARGGPRYYILDNEPSLWHQTHRDVRPRGATRAEVRRYSVQYARRIKDIDPGALIVAPEEWGWTGFFHSGADQQEGAGVGWSNPAAFADRRAAGGADYLPWYLQQMAAASKQAGKRLLDVFTVHWYPQGGEFSSDTSQAMQMRRNRSTRSLWDPSYRDETWINDRVRLIPRLREWVSKHYPGTRIGITEYSWGADNHRSGAIAQADVLGIFGREGLDIAARWVAPEPDTPVAEAFRIYRNYDGRGGAFGERSVAARVPNPDDVAAFAALRAADGALTVVVLNKRPVDPASIVLRVAGHPWAAAEVWQLGDSTRIARAPDAKAAAGALRATLPAQSIAIFVLPRGSAARPAA